MVDPVAPRAGMSLSFADEFERTSINDTGSPGWLTTYYWGARRLAEFNQQQLFVDSGYGAGIDPFVFNNGTMDITAQKTPADVYDQYSYPYLSGHINTYDTFNFRYGYIEMRAKVAAGQGFLETFYASRTDKSVLGEIDILEFIGSQPKALYGTVHYDDNGTLTKSKVVRAAQTEALSADYHTYAVDWTPTSIRFYLDGVLTGEITTPESLKAAVYLMADFSVGGTWAGYPDATTPFPSAYSIDYIRVWQDASAFAPETVTGTGGSESLAGGDGADFINAGAGNDTVLAGNGGDLVRGGPGDDRLQGNGGNDTLVGEAGVDQLQGGPDNDFYPLLNLEDTITEGKLGGFDTVLVHDAVYTLPNNVEALIYTGKAAANLKGQWSSNFIAGGNAGDTLDGSTGNDTLNGGAGADRLLGGGGNDSLIATRGGSDTLNGGGGRDTFMFGTASGATIVVQDYTPGIDWLDFRRLGIDTLAELQAKMVADATGSMVTVGTTKIHLNVAPSAVKAADIVSGALPTAVQPVASVLSNQTILASTPVGSAVSIFVPKDVPEVLSYSLLSGGAGLFAIEGRELFVKGALTGGQNYTLSVRATNEFGLARDQSYTIQTLANSAPTAVALSGISVAQGATVGTVVGTLSATDPDPGDVVSYTLTGNASGHFALNGSQLIVNSALEAVPYTVTVAATDLGGLTISKNFTINVTSDVVLDGVTVNGIAGHDIITPTQTLAGQSYPGAKGDLLRGNGGNDTLNGGDGDDRLEGGAGADRMLGSAGADTYVGGTGLDLVSYAAAASAIALDMMDPNWAGALGDAQGDVFSEVESLEGSAFGDSLYASMSANRLSGLGGADLLVGRAGNDTMFGGDGADTLDGGAGNDSMVGQGGNDVFLMRSGSGQDLISGFQFGSTLGDVIKFETTLKSFSDVLANASDVVGGTSPFGTTFTGVVISYGADKLYVSGATIAKLNANDFAFGAPPPSGVSVMGTASDDIITPTQTVPGQPMPGTGNDTVKAGDGDDFLAGGTGNDFLQGEIGNDTLEGGAGPDILDGGVGFDIATYASATSAVAVDMLINNWAGAKGDGAGDIFYGVDALDGSSFDDILKGINEGVRLSGLGGNDSLEGRAGSDTLLGGDGNDTLNAGSGQDSLNGGAGNDLFVFGASAGQDVIAGFTPGAAVADIIKFVGVYADYSALLAATHDEAGVTSPFGSAFTGTVIGAGADQVWLSGVTKAQLSANDFIFA